MTFAFRQEMNGINHVTFDLFIYECNVLNGLFNIKPGRFKVVCPLSHTLKLVGENVVLKIWCLDLNLTNF